MRFYSFFLLCCCLLSSACAGGVAEQSPIAAVQPSSDESSVLAQSESPLVVQSDGLTATPTPEPVTHSEGGFVSSLDPQADYLVATISNDLPQNTLHILPDAEIWIRNRIALANVVPGEWIARVDGYGTMTVFADPATPFTDVTLHDPGPFEIAQVQAVDSQAQALQVSLEDGTTTTVEFPFCLRIFRQERATLADIEIGDWVQFNGILPDGPDSQVVEVDQFLTSGRSRVTEPVQTTLACTPSGDFAHCIDERLGIEFEHPTVWGTITSTFSESNYCGYSYNYDLWTRGIVASGVSGNFMEPHGGGAGTFGGFTYSNSPGPCRQYGASICEEVEPGVIFMVRVPEAQWVCNPSSGVFHQPEAIVAIDLPDNEIINGFGFISPFLSDSRQQEIEQLEIQPGGGLNCQGEGPQQFDALMQKLVEQINTGTLDEQTQTNLQAIRHLAESIRAIE